MKRPAAALALPAGALCFLIAQPLLRLPLLRLISSQARVALWYVQYPFLILILLSLSAGLFEEAARCLFRRFAFRAQPISWLQPLLFGLGHGLAEALLILPAFIGAAPAAVAPAILERLFAVLMHIGLTFIIWNGFQKGMPFRHLLLAILLHAAVNLLAAGLLQAGFDVWSVETALGVIAVLFVLYAFRSRKLYPEGE